MTATKRTIADRLRKLGACEEAVERARQYQSATKAWAEWPNGGEMLWLIFRAGQFEQGSAGHRKAIRCVIECVRTGLVHAGDCRTELEATYDALERWANGDDSVDLGQTADAAWQTADAARRTAVAARQTAVAAWRTADAAWRTAVAAWQTADAAWRTAVAARQTADECEAPMVASERLQADIVRQHYPKPPTVKR